MRYLLIVVVLTAIAACGGEADSGAADDAAPAAQDGLTETQLEHGIGPIEQLTLGSVDQELADAGEAIFTTKCSACHKMGERYVGPPLGNVLDTRTPEFIMNMMLNPEEMIQKHPEVRAMLAQYMTPMPNQQLTQEDARAVLEYLRTQSGTTE